MADMKTLSDGTNTFTVVDQNAVRKTEDGRITEVADPVEDTDAVNKKYVDGKIVRNKRLSFNIELESEYVAPTKKNKIDFFAGVPDDPTYIEDLKCDAVLYNGIVYVEVSFNCTNAFTGIIGTYSGELLDEIEKYTSLKQHDSFRLFGEKSYGFHLNADGTVYFTCNNYSIKEPGFIFRGFFISSD